MLSIVSYEEIAQKIAVFLPDRSGRRLFPVLLFLVVYVPYKDILMSLSRDFINFFFPLDRQLTDGHNQLLSYSKDSKVS